MISVSANQQKVLDAGVKKVYWLFDIDVGATGSADYYLSTAAMTYNSNSYTANVKDFTPITDQMADCPLGIFPPFQTTLKLVGIDGIELTPDSTAVADGIGRTEADATTGWDEYSAPATFESTAAGTPNEGSYHFHLSDAGTGGFEKGSLTLVSGDDYELTFDCKVVSGTLRVVIYDGDGSVLSENNLYTDASYTSKTLSATSSVSGSSGKILFYVTGGGEFYVDNVSFRRKKKAYPSNFEGAAITARLVVRANVDVTPSGTSVADAQTEADATTGWIEYGSPDTAESTAAGTPDTGSYHFHIVEGAAADSGFQIESITLVAGEPIVLTFADKVAGGTLQVEIFDGDGSVLNSSTYTNAGYANQSISDVIENSGSSGKLLFSTNGAAAAFYFDNVKLMTTQEIEFVWRFIVKNASSTDQVLTLECQDWFTPYLEGDYPNTPLIKDLFPVDAIKDDGACIPIQFGTPYYPHKVFFKSYAAVYVSASSFTVALGSDTLSWFAGQVIVCDCGADGQKVCKIASATGTTGNITVTLTVSGSWQAVTSNLASYTVDGYLLGSGAPTYTLTKIRPSKDTGIKSEYSSSDYDFTKKGYLVSGRDGTSYDWFYPLMADYDNDGTNETIGYWKQGKEVMDSNIQVSRNDTVNLTDPTEVAETIMEIWGIPSAEIDDTLKATAAAIFAGRSFTLDLGLWHSMPRVKLLAKLFAISGMIPIYRDKVGYKVLTKVSQKTITEAMIRPGSFSVSRMFTEEKKRFRLRDLAVT